MKLLLLVLLVGGIVGVFVKAHYARPTVMVYKDDLNYSRCVDAVVNKVMAEYRQQGEELYSLHIPEVDRVLIKYETTVRKDVLEVGKCEVKR